MSATLTFNLNGEDIVIESWHVVNSCLFPTGGLVAPVGGHISVRTVEGVTAKNEEGAPIFPKAEATGKAIAESNGSQCAFTRW